MSSRITRLARGVSVYAKLAWWGLVAPRVSGAKPPTVHQAVILRDSRVLLSLRSDLRGWELPGGNEEPGETGEATIRREVREETGLEVDVVARVGDYVRTGFLPHTARIHRCRVTGGELRTSRETPRVDWFPIDALPDTLFPWYRGPLADALREPALPVERREHQGIRAILAGMRIDLTTRLSGED